MEKGKEYYAFISYKREDEKWAKWLQEKLEHYKFPTNLNGRNDLPKHIRPTFRDVTDLKPGLLAEEINNALLNSEWLIVVCSPRSAKSPWVCKEAQTFIDLGRADHIIPFVIEGNPFSNDTATECYPEALLNLTGSKELLAANINEMGRDAAAIKVVARMFNLRFDALWQRFEREQKRKRWMWVGGAILLSLFGLSIGGYFVEQNRTIERQNSQLETYVSELKEANNTYSQFEGDNKLYMHAGELRGNGCDDLWSMNFAYHPYEPIVAFSDDWGFWIHYINSNVEKLLPIDKEFGFGEVERLCFSPDGAELMAEGHFGIYIWNVDKCELLKHYWHNDNLGVFFSEANKDSLIEKRRIQLCSTIGYTYRRGVLTIFDKTSRHKNVSTNMVMTEDTSLLCLPNPVYNEALFVTGERTALYDIEKNTFTLFFKGYKELEDFEFDTSGEILRVGKNLYSRTIRTDTIANLGYTTRPKNVFPSFKTNKNLQYDEATGASIEASDFAIKYKRGSVVKQIEVLKDYTTGNGQEYLSYPIFAGSNKIVAIVEQGKHRIYNTNSWTLVGTLDNYVWDGKNECLGYECQLSHAESYIFTATFTNNRLFVVSSGGIVRVYNVNRPRLEAVIELPIKRGEFERVGCVDKLYITDDGSEIYYSFEDQDFYYHCKLPKFQVL